MSHLGTYGDAPNCTWTDLAFPTLAVTNTGRKQADSVYRGLDDNEEDIKRAALLWIRSKHSIVPVVFRATKNYSNPAAML